MSSTTDDHHCGVVSTLHRPWDTEGYCEIKATVLGERYDLSIVLIGDTRARTLNRAHRARTTPANVLSFPVTPRAGEIFLNIARIRREAATFGLSPEGHARFLLIHGCLHLKGYSHGGTMERAEARLLKRFNVR
jgi:probable rRNA maturation factor